MNERIEVLQDLLAFAEAQGIDIRLLLSLCMASPVPESPQDSELGASAPTLPQHFYPH